MLPIDASVQEDFIIDMLQRTGPCCLDDLVRYLPNLSWGEVFVAIDRMSRDGRVLLRQLGYSTYQITLYSQLASPPPFTISPGGGAPTTPLAAWF
jgi:hypothetical protein